MAGIARNVVSCIYFEFDKSASVKAKTPAEARVSSNPQPLGPRVLSGGHLLMAHHMLIICLSCVPSPQTPLNMVQLHGKN